MNPFPKIELVDIIRQYDIRVGTIESYPSFHVLKTDRGSKVLKVWNDIETLKQANNFRETLVYSGFRKIDRFISTKDGKQYVLHKDQGFTLTDLSGGMVPSTNREMDIKIVGTTLAQFHQAVNKINVKDDESFKIWSKQFERGLEHINNIEKNISDRNNKNKLDETVLSELTKFKKQVSQSIQMAKKVERNYFKNGNTPKWCHGNLNLSSFRVDEFGEGWIIDLGIPVIDIPAYDTAKLISFIYKKSGYNVTMVNHILDNYQEVLSLETEDKLWILTYIAYPHDLWKFLYIYYVVKVPKINDQNKQFDNLVEEQIKIDKLYHHLFSYFEL